MFLKEAQTLLRLITSQVVAPKRTVAGPKNTLGATKTDQMRPPTDEIRTPDSQSRVMNDQQAKTRDRFSTVRPPEFAKVGPGQYPDYDGKQDYD